MFSLFEQVRFARQTDFAKEYRIAPDAELKSRLDVLHQASTAAALLKKMAEEHKARQLAVSQ